MVSPALVQVTYKVEFPAAQRYYLELVLSAHNHNGTGDNESYLYWCQYKGIDAHCSCKPEKGDGNKIIVHTQILRANWNSFTSLNGTSAALVRYPIHKLDGLWKIPGVKESMMGLPDLATLRSLDYENFNSCFLQDHSKPSAIQKPWGRQHGELDRALDLYSHPRFKSCSNHLLVLFHCSPELNSSKSQLVCLLSVGILKVTPSTEIEVAIDLKLCKVVVNVSNFKEMQYSEDLTLSKTYVRDMYICLIVSKKCMPTKSHYEYWCLKI